GQCYDRLASATNPQGVKVRRYYSVIIGAPARRPATRAVAEDARGIKRTLVIVPSERNFYLGRVGLLVDVDAETNVRRQALGGTFSSIAYQPHYQGPFVAPDAAHRLDFTSKPLYRTVGSASDFCVYGPSPPSEGCQIRNLLQDPGR
nr:hypothetical protein [Pseudomonadota bacterium]